MAVKNTTQVLIDGKIITLGGYESPEYLQKVAAYLNQKISELSQSAGYNRLSVDTKHTLLALNIADDYFKAKSQVDTLEEDMEAKDRETYDMKHDLIAAEIQAGDLKKELEERDRLCVGFMKLQQFTQEAGSPVRLALSTADRSLRSCSVTCSGSLIRQIRIWKIY